MAPKRAVGARVRARIKHSGQTLTVVFPAVRPTVVSASPGSAPVRPFTGTRPVPTLAGPAGTPTRAAVTLNCLWLDVDALGALRGPRAGAEHGLWTAGATALARIDPEDLPLDATNVREAPEPFFAAAEYIEFQGKRYALHKVTPAGPSDDRPYTWYLWLGSYAKQ